MFDANATPGGKLISAIVCTYNRYEDLADSLTSLTEQTLPRDRYEIIVVDNSSDVKTQKSFWRRNRTRFDVIVDIQAEPGLSRARNVGIRRASAPIVAFCDDDAIVSGEWLASLVSLFHDEPKAGVGGGPVVPIWPKAPPPWLHPWLSGFFTIVERGAARRRMEEGEWLAGTNVAFRREPLIEVGGFDEALGRRGTLLLSNEDLEIVRRLAERGLYSFYEPSALVRHKVHADRVNQAWLRRRVAWQVVSDALLPDGGPAGGVAPRQRWDAISDYVLRLPPEMRTFRGLFLDTDDPDALQRQCEAITALMSLIMSDARDPEVEREVAAE